MTVFRYRLLDKALERKCLPDALLRLGAYIGTVIRQRRESRGGLSAQERRLRALVTAMSRGPIALSTDEANRQHYEHPAEFLQLLLGPRMKYSCCLWGPGASTLAAAEEAMLTLTCERAGVKNGHRILDLGCGWGSLAIWMAERFPQCSILGVSNSSVQKLHIDAQLTARGIANVEIVTADVNQFEPDGQLFDRVISVEMFEHMRNWKQLTRQIASWIEPQGKVFIQTFSHRQLAYVFESTWAAERIFTGGVMPSHDLLLHFQDELRVTDRWAVSGRHYAMTLDAWLSNLSLNALQARQALLKAGLSNAEARRLIGIWRLFFISASVMWRFRAGERWHVSHYLLELR